MRRLAREKICFESFSRHPREGEEPWTFNLEVNVHVFPPSRE
jgi:hypothetical protein